MQAILKPISHPELGELVISESLFCVGRDDEAFAGLPHTRTGRLSRRHARLFEQDGVIYIVDLGSRNGTFVQGERIDGWVRLSPGHTIRFGWEGPEVEILAPDAAATATHSGTSLRVAAAALVGGARARRPDVVVASVTVDLAEAMVRVAREVIDAAISDELSLLEADEIFVGLIAMIDPPRPDPAAPDRPPDSSALACSSFRSRPL